jgi:CBS-domain-containing membrane protein
MMSTANEAKVQSEPRPPEKAAPKWHGYPSSASLVKVGSVITSGRLSGSSSGVTTPPALRVSELASIALAAALMVSAGVHELRVVDAELRVLGTITAVDVMRFMAREEGYLLPGRAASE